MLARIFRKSCPPGVRPAAPSLLRVRQRPLIALRRLANVMGWRPVRLPPDAPWGSDAGCARLAALHHPSPWVGLDPRRGEWRVAPVPNLDLRAMPASVFGQWLITALVFRKGGAEMQGREPTCKDSGSSAGCSGLVCGTRQRLHACRAECGIRPTLRRRRGGGSKLRVGRQHIRSGPHRNELRRKRRRGRSCAVREQAELLRRGDRRLRRRGGERGRRPWGRGRNFRCGSRPEECCGPCCPVEEGSSGHGGWVRYGTVEGRVGRRCNCAWQLAQLLRGESVLEDIVMILKKYYWLWLWTGSAA